jgi:hypothetical protein
MSKSYVCETQIMADRDSILILMIEHLYYLLTGKRFDRRVRYITLDHLNPITAKQFGLLHELFRYNKLVERIQNASEYIESTRSKLGEPVVESTIELGTLRHSVQIVSKRGQILRQLFWNLYSKISDKLAERDDDLPGHYYKEKDGDPDGNDVILNYVESIRLDQDCFHKNGIPMSIFDAVVEITQQFLPVLGEELFWGGGRF